MGPPVHPALTHLAQLVGTWRGHGQGSFPTISAFNYGEEVTFWHTGKPVLCYSQKTWNAASGEPMHAESGYFRPKPGGLVEAVIAQSTGIAEVQKGTFDWEKGVMDLTSSLVGNASKVVTISRLMQISGNELSYTVKMATTNQSLQSHLKATLTKTG